MPLVLIYGKVPDSVMNLGHPLQTIFYLLIPAGPHMKNFPTITLHGISKEGTLFSLSDKTRKIYFEKKEIVRAFGINRKQLELHLRRHKDSTPVKYFHDPKDPKNRKTLVHVSILPYLIRCLSDTKKKTKEEVKKES